MTTVDQAVEKSLSKTWMWSYGENPAYRNVAPSTLRLLTRGHPKYCNDMTAEQLTIEAQVYREILRQNFTEKHAVLAGQVSWYVQCEQLGTFPDGTPFPANGAQVATVRGGIFGMPMRILGHAHRQGNGRYIVRIDPGQPVSGAKTTPLTQAWHNA